MVVPSSCITSVSGLPAFRSVKTYLEPRAVQQVFAHAYAMSKSPDIQLAHLKELGQMQHSKCVIGLVGHVEISLLVKVVHHICDIVVDAGAEFVQAVKKADDGTTKAASDH